MSEPNGPADEPSDAQSTSDADWTPWMEGESIRKSGDGEGMEDKLPRR